MTTDCLAEGTFELEHRHVYVCTQHTFGEEEHSFQMLAMLLLALLPYSVCVFLGGE